ncbi:MAG: MATE family efflux transporter [Phyllobacteriaceae bacterium]|nr:MATE family efflux transporter [Phyllobacteriaceae bacterium]
MARKPSAPVQSGPAFLTGSTMRHVVVMSTTGALGLVAIFLVDLANLFYISLLGQQELAAAIGYASTIMFFAVSVCIGFTIAAGALTARAIGSGNERRAKAYAGASLIFMLAVSIIMAIILYAAIGWALDLLGAEGRTKEIAAGFMSITIPSIPLLGIGMASAGLLRAKGDAKRAMYVTLSSGVSAAAFDPLLIFYFDLGVTGAAISVVIVRVMFVLVGFHGTIRVHDMVRMPNAEELHAFASPFFRIAGPAVLTQVATPVGNAYVTSTVAGFGDDAVAGWAIVGRIIPLAFAAIFALSGAVGPILAQNYGAGRLDRVNSTMRDSLVFTLVYVAAMWALLAVLKTPITLVFGAEGDAQQMIGSSAISLQERRSSPAFCSLPMPPSTISTIRSIRPSSTGAGQRWASFRLPMSAAAGVQRASSSAGVLAVRCSAFWRSSPASGCCASCRTRQRRRASASMCRRLPIRPSLPAAAPDCELYQPATASASSSRSRPRRVSS